MLTLFRIVNVVLIVSLIGCILGAIAGLIVFVPILAGAWVLNTMALVAYEERARPGWIRRLHAARDRPHVAPPPAEEERRAA